MMPKFEPSEAGERQGERKESDPKIRQELFEIIKTGDMEKAGAFYRANYEAFYHGPPRKVRTSVSDQEFEEIMDAVKARDWDLFYELTDDLTLQARDELEDRLQQTDEYSEARYEQRQQTVQRNRPIIQQQPLHLQEALEEYILTGDTYEAACIAKMDMLEFDRFVRSLNLNYG